MIKELHLNNWKSFADARLYVDQLTFIIGTNASGKSNILDALSFLHFATMGMPVETVLKEHIRGGAEWAVRKGADSFYLGVIDEQNGYDYEYSISCGFSENKGIELQSERLKRKGKTDRKSEEEAKTYFETCQQDVDSVTTSMPVKFMVKRGSQKKRLDLSKKVSVLSQHEVLPINKLVKDACSLIAEDLKSIFVFNPIPNHMRNYCGLSDKLNEDAGNIAGVIAGLAPDAQKDLESKISEYVRPLPERDINKVWAETVGRFKNDAMLYCEECWHDGQREVMDARSMSDGTLRFVAIVTALLTGKPNSLLVIEEIDNGLHPSRAGELVRVLKKLGSERHIDLLCTTHNPVLIDTLGVEMIPFISFVSRSKTDGTSIIEPVEDCHNLMKLMANYSVGELMTNDKLTV